MTQPKAIGIDLGTTNSAVAWVDASGHTAMVPNAEGDLLTPSVVLFEDAEVIVGKDARNATVVNPERVAVWVKRDMGSPVYNRRIRGQFLPPEVIQACILRKLKTDVVHALGPESRVVITVPAYFDEPRRKATADAGEMAGLKILDIVNEPTAGALAFGEVLGYLTPGAEALQEMTVMVYDLGGGTFDVTLLRLAPGKIHTIATDGDVQLGGYDWDLRLVQYVAEAFQRAHGVDPRTDASTTGRLFNAAVDAKHALSARMQTVIRIDYAGRSLDVPITRQQFEEMTADLLERTSYTTRQLLAAAKLQWQDVSRVLLVGGSTRMPIVQRTIEGLTGIVPDHNVNPDEAVARGAALYAQHLLDKEGDRRPAFEVTNVNAHSLGVEGIDPETMRKKNVILISRNTSLPAKFQERFITKSEGQRSIVVQVLEGESSLPGDCTAIGRTVIRDLPPNLPQGWPVDVTFEYAANGRLTVRAVVPGTHREVSLDMERSAGLSNEGVARWKQAIDSEGGFDAFESMLMELLGKAGVGGHKDAAANQPKSAAEIAAGLLPSAIVQPDAQPGAMGSSPPPGGMGGLPALAPGAKGGSPGGMGGLSALAPNTGLAPSGGKQAAPGKPALAPSGGKQAAPGKPALAPRSGKQAAAGTSPGGMGGSPALAPGSAVTPSGGRKAAPGKPAVAPSSGRQAPAGTSPGGVGGLPTLAPTSGLAPSGGKQSAPGKPAVAPNSGRQSAPGTPPALAPTIAFAPNSGRQAAPGAPPALAPSSGRQAAPGTPPAPGMPLSGAIGGGPSPIGTPPPLGPPPAAVEPWAQPLDSQPAAPRRRLIPGWLMSMVGHFIAAVVGLGGGYLLLAWMKPDKFPLPFHWFK